MRNLYLGIDIGSVAIALVVINEEKQVLYRFYEFHHGQILEKLSDSLNKIELDKIKTIAYTSSTPPIMKYGISVDSRIAFISAGKHLHPQLRALLVIGAEKFGLATFDEHGEYLNYRSNSSCAAGTGNFLDQQAERLNLKDIGEFGAIAYENTGDFPKIASRCAVFAKTDLIHAQQEGYSMGEICDGLSYGLAKNIVDTLFIDQISIENYNKLPKQFQDYSHRLLELGRRVAFVVQENQEGFGHAVYVARESVGVDRCRSATAGIRDRTYVADPDRAGVAPAASPSRGAAPGSALPWPALANGIGKSWGNRVSPAGRSMVFVRPWNG